MKGRRGEKGREERLPNYMINNAGCLSMRCGMYIFCWTLVSRSPDPFLHFRYYCAIAANSGKGLATQD